VETNSSQLAALFAQNAEDYLAHSLKENETVASLALLGGSKQTSGTVGSLGMIITMEDDDDQPPAPSNSTKEYKSIEAVKEAIRVCGDMTNTIVSCAATLPMQTQAYATVTIAINHAHANGGFAKRCIELAVVRLGYDIDVLIGVEGSARDRMEAGLRGKLLLRYLAHLNSARMVSTDSYVALLR
tara:strand:+ start:111 stop:665 length:555 start_codon:yes stop_codon:yes gene_type:complete